MQKDQERIQRHPDREGPEWRQPARKEATGYGLVYFMKEVIEAKGKSFRDAKVVVSGSGNVAIYATEKAQQYGAKVIALSDSSGYVYDPNGIQLDVVKEIKGSAPRRIKEYADIVKGAEYHEGCKGEYGRSSAISHFRVRRRMRSMRNPLKFL